MDYKTADANAQQLHYPMHRWLVHVELIITGDQRACTVVAKRVGTSFD